MKRYAQNHARSIFVFGSTLLIIFAAISAEADQENLKKSTDRANAFILKHNIDGSNIFCCTHPGDANGDGNFNVADPVFVISYIFRQGIKPLCPNAIDVTNDCAINIADVVQMLGALFVPTWPDPSFECAPESCEYWGY